MKAPDPDALEQDKVIIEDEWRSVYILNKTTQVFSNRRSHYFLKAVTTVMHCAWSSGLSAVFLFYCPASNQALHKHSVWVWCRRNCAWQEAFQGRKERTEHVYIRSLLLAWEKKNDHYFVSLHVFEFKWKYHFWINEGSSVVQRLEIACLQDLRLLSVPHTKNCPKLLWMDANGCVCVAL